MEPRTIENVEFIQSTIVETDEAPELVLCQDMDDMIKKGLKGSYRRIPMYARKPHAQNPEMLNGKAKEKMGFFYYHAASNRIFVLESDVIRNGIQLNSIISLNPNPEAKLPNFVKTIEKTQN